MTPTAGIWLARAGGCLAGVALAAGLLLAERPAEGGAAVGAQVGIYADLNGELALSPAGPERFLSVPELRPGVVARGELLVRNQTGEAQALRVRALGSTAALDRALKLSFSADGRALRAGRLGELGRHGGEEVVLAPGESATLEARAAIATDAAPGWEAAIVDIALLFDLRDAGAP